MDSRPLHPRQPSFLGQPIFPTDKRNPMFTLYRSGTDRDAVIHVYYGLELLEIVPDARQAPMFRC